jgi:hypothetical protein
MAANIMINDHVIDTWISQFLRLNYSLRAVQLQTKVFLFLYTFPSLPFPSLPSFLLPLFLFHSLYSSIFISFASPYSRFSPCAQPVRANVLVGLSPKLHSKLTQYAGLVTFVFRFSLSAFRFPLSAFRLPLFAFRLPLSASRMQSLVVGQNYLRNVRKGAIGYLLAYPPSVFLIPAFHFPLSTLHNVPYSH